VTGGWLPADPIPDTLLVNVGDLLEGLSGGRFPATRHRVLVPTEEFRRRAPRQSIAFFVHPDDSVECGPLAGPDPRYPPVTARGHLEARFKATYGDKL
jgi:isopenicillin N synthase-like dioxygenase